MLIHRKPLHKMHLLELGHAKFKYEIWKCMDLINEKEGWNTVSRLASFEIMERLYLLLHFRRRHWQPTPVLLPGESQGRRSLMGAVYGVAQSRTRLKRLSSSITPF